MVLFSCPDFNRLKIDTVKLVEYDKFKKLYIQIIKQRFRDFTKMLLFYCKIAYRAGV